ncbi:RNA polymerase sigma factor [Streptomyces tsukubensis]|uniref:RNA polymerase sigma factor n=1 Tax=Streptomyces tsukubensis TaxID=83656 RepID=UPI0036C1ED93
MSLILSGVEPISGLRCMKDVTVREGGRTAVGTDDRSASGGRGPVSAGGDEAALDATAVIARVRAGEPEAYAVLVRAHTQAALRAAVAFGAGADAEDVVQSAFLKAYQSLDGFRPGAEFRPWLLRIVVNETRNTLRSAGRRQALAGREAQLLGPRPVIPESADPAVSAESEERRAELTAALGELSEEQRQVVTYRYLLEMDEAETAEALGWPRGTVKSRLSRALAKLGRLIGAADRGEGR